MSRTLPELGIPQTPRRPRIHRRTLANGLRVAVLRKNETPIVEVRLGIPAAVTSASVLARLDLLSASMTTGTKNRDRHELEQALGMLGADLNVGHDADKLIIGGYVLAENLEQYLELLVDLLTAASYPTSEVERERDRRGEQLQMANASAGTIAAKALSRKLYRSHRYSLLIPEIADIAGVSAAGLRTLHRNRVIPADASLVLVGNIQPSKALDALERTLGDWRGEGGAEHRAKDPFAGKFDESDAVTLIHRPGSVQSAIRLGFGAIGRTDDQYAAARVACMMFGGYFSSRLVANLREDKGYTYTPRSGISLHAEAAVITVSADVSTEVTAAALNEIRYELGRIVSTLAEADELDNARQFLIGGGLLSLSTQNGLATTAASMEYDGVGLEFLYEHQRALAKVSAHDVLEVSQRLLAPSLARTVVVGDSDAVSSQLQLLGSIERD